MTVRGFGRMVASLMLSIVYLTNESIMFELTAGSSRGSCDVEGRVYPSETAVPRDHPCHYCICFQGQVRTVASGEGSSVCWFRVGLTIGIT